MSTQHTPEQIAEARELVADFLDCHAFDSAVPLTDDDAAMMRILLAATEPRPASAEGWCQICAAKGKVSEHQCFFGPEEL
jgi:hypothetical protein